MTEKQRILKNLDNNARRYSECKECPNCSKIIRNCSFYCQTCVLLNSRIRYVRQTRGYNHRWKGGRITTTQGYIKILMPRHPKARKDGYMFEHRWIMEKHIRRFLKSKEVVHHINHNMSDNRIENLQLFENHTQHLSYERQRTITLERENERLRKLLSTVDPIRRSEKHASHKSSRTFKQGNRSVRNSKPYRKVRREGSTTKSKTS